MHAEVSSSLLTLSIQCNKRTHDTRLQLKFLFLIEIFIVTRMVLFVL